MDECGKIIKKIEMVLNNFPDIPIGILFGSAANNRLRLTSDIDIAVAGQRPLSYDQKKCLIFTLFEELSYKIDLIDLQEVSGAILQQILCKGIIVKKKDIPLYALLLRKMWYNQEDMMPYSRMILKRHCQKFIYG